MQKQRLHGLAVCLAAVFAILVVAHGTFAQELSEAALKNLPFRSIGPAVMGGRIDDVAVDPRDQSIIYVGSASGGLWKTTNRGVTWEPLFDDQDVSSIGDIAIAPSSPDTVWVGTGEPNNRQSSTFGQGVYKSTDGGHSWTNMGLRDTHHIGRVLVDPVDPDVVYVAALGHLWGPSMERGLFKTTDGGRTWTNTKFIDEHTGFVDAVIDPTNRQVLYAAAYQRRRAPWGFNGGGPGSGLYKTTDAGRTWRKLTNGLPDGSTGRIGLTIYPRDPKILYATVENARGGTFRSDDAGETWAKVTDVNPRPMYYSKIHVDPTNDRRIYILGSSMFVSNDGGRTFADPRTGRAGSMTSMSPTYDVGVHGDHHALWINPADPKHLILGNDGGLYFSYDAGISWDKVNNFPIGQFYSIDVDNRVPYNIYGGLQDTHSFGGPSATRHYIGILNDDWFQINTGDGMYQRVDPNDPDVIYTESQDGNISRFDRRTGDKKGIRPMPKPGETPYRFNWTSPIVVSRHGPGTIYFGGNRVFKSTDAGDSWTASQDLTRAEDREKLAIMGALPTREVLSRNDGVGAWGTLTTLAESPIRAGILWAGSDDGLAHVSRDGGVTWTNVTDFPGVTGKGRVSRVEPSAKDEATAYLSLERHQDDDFAPYLFVTRDFGKTWRSIAGNLPKLGWINVVKEHPKNPRTLFVGTETGLYVTVDGGAHWTRFRGFPTVPVDDLVIHPRDNDLVIGTHGRSIYILDDVTPLHEASVETLGAAAHLFTPRPAMLMQLWKRDSYGAQRQFIGPNPPNGAILNYHLRAASPADVTLVIRDAQGQVIRSIAGTRDAGLNRVVWDLRVAGPAGVAGARGPHVVLGTYTVELQVAGTKAATSVVPGFLTAEASAKAVGRATLQVVPDPISRVTDADRKARFEFLSRVNAMRADAQTLGDQLARVRTQVNAFLESAKGQPAAQPVLKLAQTFASDIQAAQARAGGGGGGGDEEGGGFGGGGLRNRLSSLFGEFDGSGAVQGTMTGPTSMQRQRLSAAETDLKTLQEAVAALVGARLTELNDEIYRLRLPRIVR